ERLHLCSETRAYRSPPQLPRLGLLNWTVRIIRWVRRPHQADSTAQTTVASGPGPEGRGGVNNCRLIARVASAKVSARSCSAAGLRPETEVAWCLGCNDEVARRRTLI